MLVTSTHLTFAGDGVTLAADRWEPARGQEQRGVVLLLHGGGQTRHSWRHTGRRLAHHGWDTIALDARGHGDSDWAADGDYGVDALVADLHAVTATLPSRPVVVGASMGGITALVAQGEDPALGRALVLVDVTPTIEPEGTAEIKNFMLSGIGGFASLDEAAAAVVAYNPARQRAPRPDGLRKNLREIDGRWYWHWDPRMMTGAAGADPDKSLGSDPDALATRTRAAARAVTVPTLLVRGAQSKVVSTAGARELLRLIPTAQLVDVAGAGHMVAGDDNDVFAEGLLDFLDGPVAQASR